MSEGEAALRTGRETLAGVRERTEVSRGHRRPRAGSARRGRACTVHRWRLSERRRELGGQRENESVPAPPPAECDRQSQEERGAGGRWPRTEPASNRPPRRAWRLLHSGCAPLGDAAAQPLTHEFGCPGPGLQARAQLPAESSPGPAPTPNGSAQAPMPAPSPTRLPTGRLQTQWHGPGLPRMAGRDPAPPTAAASERLAPQPTVAGGSPRVLRPQTVALGLSCMADFSQTCSEKRRS